MAHRDPVKLLTVEEYERLPNDPFFRDELSRGRVVREPPPGARHSIVAMKIAGALDVFVKSHGLGCVVIKAGFRLATSPPSVRAPDVAFIAKERLLAETPVSFWPLAPDLAIEIVSPWNKAFELEAKVLDYLDAGTRMVWVIDPQSRTARSYRGNEARLLREHDQLEGEDVVIGFTLPLSAILI